MTSLWGKLFGPEKEEPKAEPIEQPKEEIKPEVVETPVEIKVEPPKETPTEQPPKASKPKTKKKLNRRTLIDKHPKLREVIADLTAKENTGQEIADIVGVSRRTLVNWKADDLALAAQIRAAEKEATGIVEANLFKRSTDYDYTEEGIFQGVPVTVKRHAPPDPTCMKYWLGNRSDGRWKEKAEQVHVFKFGEQVESGSGTTKI